jgi:hypothetical protein
MGLLIGRKRHVTEVLDILELLLYIVRRDNLKGVILTHPIFHEY